MALLSPPPPISSFQSVSCLTSLAYERFMQEHYPEADCFDHHQSNGGNLTEWVACLNRVLCIAFNSMKLIDDAPSLLDNGSLAENCAILNFIDTFIPPNFTLCIGIIPSRTSAKNFFDAIEAQCCPGSRFQKLKVV
ncbi:hypothetical protein O181_117735 [Austropuccinia psidii MF-1]|uniref:Uncharacterized protein n=1 Tax=Austropuccinia psidii MF-1 TaxID=1389203 RepID=A0A9Q3KEY6_9BASI|nr:hypothetical protein [Austropuccinia psidii MF-1]